MIYDIRHGDCIEVMRTMADGSVDSIVTDPPYGLSFMGKRWDYDVPSVEVWAECLRVLKPGGHLLAFAGTRTQHRMAVRIEDAGFDIRDMIAWVYGSGFPKSHNLDGDWKGWGTALKPAMEPITVARKPLCGNVAENVLTHGTGAINVDGCRVGTDDNLNGGGYSGGTPKTMFSGLGRLQPTQYQQPSGRWPANLIHDGSDEVVGMFPQCKSGKPGDAVRTAKGMVLQGGGNGTPLTGFGDSGSAARFFYCAKASKSDREFGCDGLEIRQTIGGGGTNDPNGDDVCGKYGSVKSPARNHHPTVKPTDLMRYLCRLVTPPGGMILDPFMGSGSTGKAAIIEGFRFVGIEREAEYVEIARQRIGKAIDSPLFAQTDPDKAD